MRGTATDERPRVPRRRLSLAMVGALLIFGAVVAAGALAASTDFSQLPSSPEATGDGPADVVAADLDADTDLDLAVANANGDNVTILKNDGSGNFTEPATSPESVGDGPQGIVAGDLDGDGDVDLVTANANSNNVTILRNGGAGNFGEPGFSPKPVGAFPFSLALAKLDADGDLDLAVANEFDDNVTVLKNKGTGDFTIPASSPEATGGFPVAIAAADLDGDGDNDLATANSSDGTVTVLKNSGTANFFEPSSSPETAPSARAIAVVNVDGDADLDLAVPAQSLPGVTILKNKGNGNLFQPTSSPELISGSGPIDVAAADFDADGDLDLAVADSGSSDVTVLRNSGAGNFTEPPTSPEPADVGPNAVIAAALDADADPDLAVAAFGADRLNILGNN
jgi:FG-GAP-like repeat